VREKNRSIIIQRIYEAICFVSVLFIFDSLKEGVRYIIPTICTPFLLLYISRNYDAKRIAFAIVFSFVAFLAWTVLITFYFTNYLWKHHYIGEHSLWDILSILIPIILTVLTLFWSLKRRYLNFKFDGCYIGVLVITMSIVIICS